MTSGNRVQYLEGYIGTQTRAARNWTTNLLIITLPLFLPAVVVHYFVNHRLFSEVWNISGWLTCSSPAVAALSTPANRARRLRRRARPCGTDRSPTAACRAAQSSVQRTGEPETLETRSLPQRDVRWKSSSDQTGCWCVLIFHNQSSRNISR